MSTLGTTITNIYSEAKTIEASIKSELTKIASEVDQIMPALESITTAVGMVYKPAMAAVPVEMGIQALIDGVGHLATSTADPASIVNDLKKLWEEVGGGFKSLAAAGTAAAATPAPVSK